MSEVNGVVRKYGWRPELPDYRDKRYELRALAGPLPAKVDLRPGCPKKVYDQGSLGSCTANALAAAHAFDQIKQGLNPFDPSRLFIYFNEREMEGTINQDAGAYIRDGVKSLVNQGVCSESMWDYNISKFTVKPAQGCYDNAMTHQITAYLRLNPFLLDMKNCLAAGYPFTFGFSVYENFETADVARTGMMPMPGGSMRGGHAVLCVGYDDSMGRMIVRNSWGPGWGDSGYFYMPYAFIADSDNCDDMWTLRSVEG